MALETGTYISDLVSANPPGTDAISQGDDHIRLLKSTIQASFPSTLTSAAIPNISGNANKLLAINSAGTQTEWQANNSIPSGCIVMWSGAISAIPTGWFLCNGANSTPNLTERFVVHADADSGGTYAVNETGGSLTTGTHALVTAELPSHTHTLSTEGAHTHTINNNSSATASSGGTVVADWDPSVQTGSSGSHTHTVGSTGSGTAHSHGNTAPPYYALAYIMKS